MVRKRHTAEEIVAKPRQVDVLMGSAGRTRATWPAFCMVTLLANAFVCGALSNRLR